MAFIISRIDETLRIAEIILKDGHIQGSNNNG
jgi:hypothetical protein